MSDEFAETSETEHAHVCPVCGDAWRHANSECEPVYGSRRETWARCPMHEGRDD